jgi:hypothetical protein
LYCLLLTIVLPIVPEIVLCFGCWYIYQNTKEKYNQLKHHTQKITRQSYWKYIENIVTPKEEEPHLGMKKIWTYIKHKRKDNIGISSLMMDGKLFCDPASKSNILNRQFKSAFSGGEARSHQLVL